MNNDNGMKAVIAQDSSVLEDLLPVTFKSKNNLMKSQFLSFMAAVTVYSEAGYRVIRDAFESIPISIRFKSPIHTLMHENGANSILQSIPKLFTNETVQTLSSARPSCR